MSGKSHILGSTSPVVDHDYVYVTVTVDEVSTPANQILAWVGTLGGSPGQPETPLTRSYLFVPIAEEGWTEDHPVNYTSADIPGRAEPFLSYAGGGSTTFTLPLHFYALSGIDPALEPDSQSLDDIEEQVRWLDRLKAPGKHQNISYPPPPVIVRVGNIFVGRCFLTGGAIERRGPINPGTMHSLYIVYNAEFTVARASFAWASQYGEHATNVAVSGQFLTF